MLTPDFTFLHTCTAHPFIKQGMTGPEYGEPVTLRCRFDFTRKRARLAGSRGAGVLGQEVIAAGTMFCAAGTRLEPESLVDFDGRTYTVISCRPCYGFGGENHVECEIV